MLESKWLAFLLADLKTVLWAATAKSARKSEGFKMEDGWLGVWSFFWLPEHLEDLDVMHCFKSLIK